MHKYIDADVLKESINELLESPWANDKTVAQWDIAIKEALGTVKDLCIDNMPAADVEPVRHELIEQVKKYAADMEERYTEVCADFRERTGQDYVCGACKYGDCVYLGADGDYCGECPGFESNECFVLSDELKSKIWEIVDIVSGAKMDGGNK